jgi:2-isopropylmalate synthase
MQRDEANRVLIFDTTLRDGEQCPGASMGLEEKLQVARQLARLKVDIIEAGFPIASPGDFEAVREIAAQVPGPVICALARTKDIDIQRAGEAIAPAARGRIHTFSSGSDVHLKHMLRITREENLRRSVEAVKLARTHTADIEFSAQDVARSDPAYLIELYTAVAEAGATTLNIPDTVGYSTPEEFGDLVGRLVAAVRVPGVIFSVHCHNDLGLAVANSLAAVRHGARQVECTLNGIGERAGNTSLEEVVMALRTREDHYGLWTGIQSTEIFQTSRLVSQLTGLHVQRNKAIVGANAFAHESGIHQDGMLKERTTYEIMRPEDVGVHATELVLGKHSGRHAFKAHMLKLGFPLEGDALQKAYEDFIALADKKKHVYDEDLLTIMQDQAQASLQVYTLEFCQVSTGRAPTATVGLRKDGQRFQDAACGDGPIDAVIQCIERITGVRGKVLDFSLQAVTRGQDAQGEVSITVEFPARTVTGKGASTDIVEAGAKAFLNCVNRLLVQKAGPPRTADVVAGKV